MNLYGYGLWKKARRIQKKRERLGMVKIYSALQMTKLNLKL